MSWKTFPVYQVVLYKIVFILGQDNLETYKNFDKTRWDCYDSKHYGKNQLIIFNFNINELFMENEFTYSDQ